MASECSATHRPFFETTCSQLLASCSDEGAGHREMALRLPLLLLLLQLRLLLLTTPCCSSTGSGASLTGT